MRTTLEVRIGGRVLSMEGLYGDVEMATVWPGGSDTLTWTAGTRNRRRFPGGQLAQAFLGPYCVWSGIHNEPDPAQEQQAARGLWRQGDDFEALDGSGNATKVPDTAIDQAITRGLLWTRPASISSSAVDVDTTQGPVSVSAVLDAWAEGNGKRWWVTPDQRVLGVTDSSTPSWITFPLDSSLGYDLGNYASTLLGRYQTSTGYATATRTDSVAEAIHGHKEQLVDLTPRGVLTSTKANTILDSLLSYGAAVPAFTSTIETAYGEILDRSGAPVAPETVYAGPYLRIYGATDLAQRRNSAMYLDAQIGRTQVSGGVLTISPMQLTGDTLVDQLAEALNRKRKN